MQINITFKPIEDYTQMIADKISFSFTRYWDGEIAAILGRSGMNCDGCHYTPGLSEALRKTIENNRGYYHALYFPNDHTGTVNLRNGFIKYLRDVKSNVPWFDAQIWQRSFELGGFTQQVIKALTGKTIMFVGGDHLKSITDRISIKEFYEIPKIDAFNSIGFIKTDIQMFAEKYPRSIIILCAGMTSNCIIDDLFPVIGDRVTILDMGSVWDAYIGVESRRWIRRVSISNKRKSRGE
jgi:hypothetical protein